MSAIAAQARIELLLTLRRGESVLVTLVIPLALLLFFGSVKVLPTASRGIDVLLAGTISLSIISTSLVSLGIATAYERYYGVLKQLGATPLPRWGLLAAKMVSVLGIEAVQVASLCGLALLFGWRPAGSPGLAVLAILLGTLCFAGLGLAMAGGLRAEATLGAANALFLFFLLLGGLYVPLSSFPGWLEALARVLPAAPLAEILRAASRSHDVPWSALGELAAWAVAAPLLAARVFRWE